MSETIRWPDIALDDPDQAAEHIAQHNMTAARKLVNRIWLNSRRMQVTV
ncbi:hypothetical protein QUF72_17900 [Desulfobacterales bacterium HSG2]|nr:hypothetical protein [Desulfobacterales bacterium HSG2]